VISPTGAVKVMVATKPVDFRKGAEGLAALVRETMRADPFSGAIYVFRAKRAKLPTFCIWFAFRDGRLPMASAVRANVASLAILSSISSGLEAATRALIAESNRCISASSLSGFSQIAGDARLS